MGPFRSTGQWSLTDNPVLPLTSSVALGPKLHLTDTVVIIVRRVLEPPSWGHKGGRRSRVYAYTEGLSVTVWLFPRLI